MVRRHMDVADPPRRQDHSCHSVRPSQEFEVDRHETPTESSAPSDEITDRDYEGAESDCEGEKCNQKGRAESRRSRFHTTIKETIQKILPRSQTELKRHFYESDKLDIVTHKDFNTLSMEFMDSEKAAWFNKDWMSILDKTNEDFFADRGRFMNVAESSAWILKILKFNSIDPKQFILDAYNVVNRINPKVNCLMLHGEPNAGKTLIGNSIVESCVFYSVISQMSGKSSFEFQDMLLQRIVLINEPKITDLTIELFKNICEGQSITIDCKYRSAQSLPRTPLVCATNANLTFYTTNRSTNEKAINARVYRYNLKTFPDLVSCYAQIHPYAWKGLIDMFVYDRKDELPIECLSL